MNLLRTCIALVLMAAAVRAQGTANVRGRPSGPVKSASDARALTARVDAVLAARWAEAKVRPAAVADDGEFLRRVSLDLIGKIPTAAEARDFLDDPSKGKRLALVERLLDSPAYTTRATEIWRQLLLPEADTEDVARQVAGSFEAWLRKKVIEEAGYDRIVREILTAKLSGRPGDMLLNAAAARPVSRGLLSWPRRASPRTWQRAWRACSSESAWNVPSATITRLPIGSGSNSGAWPRFSRNCRPTAPENADARAADRDAAPRRELDDSRDEKGRQGDPPGRFHTGMAAPRRHP